jgi:hypothetical protein
MDISDSELNKNIRRIIDKGLDPGFKANYIYELRPEDVMKILNCSRRTAIEYIDALKALSW